MWGLVNETPFAAERSWVRDKDGAEVWVVAVRGTFDFSPDGELELSDPQPPVCQFAQYEEDDDESAVMVADTDLVECKRSTDVLINGTAYAPGGEPAPQWIVRLQVGSIDKSLLISGPRRWLCEEGQAPRLSDPEPIGVLPIRYTAAFGGPDVTGGGTYVEANPVGCGFASEPAALGDQQAPSVEYADSPITAWDDRPPPAGLGPVSASWSPRREAAGTHDDKWVRERYPLAPEDRDPRFFQCAPADQQTQGFLRGGELLSLQGLTRNGFVELRLPNARFDVTTRFGDGSRRRHRMQLYTVVVEPDAGRLALVWQTHLRCHQQVNELVSTRVLLKRRLHRKSGDDAPRWAAQA